MSRLKEKKYIGEYFVRLVIDATWSVSFREDVSSHRTSNGLQEETDG